MKLKKEYKGLEEKVKDIKEINKKIEELETLRNLKISNACIVYKLTFSDFDEIYRNTTY
jgi:hypothetical protein